MLKTCREIVKNCRLCQILKRRHNLAHKHFRAKLFSTPRTAYGADYYGVKKNSLGYNNILGIIDLNTGNLVLRAVKKRTGHNTAHVILYDVIMKKGIPLIFHSDGAKEFLLGAAEILSKLLDYQMTSTKAHNPQANAKMERVWQFVGNCLQSMTSKQYENFDKYMDILSHVWNTTPDTDSGLTPFQLEHGMRARSIPDAILEIPPKKIKPCNREDLIAITTSARAFRKTLNQVKAFEKTKDAITLNAKGYAKKHFAIGDKVAFHLPPTAEQAKALSKNPKHVLQWHGPAKITESLSKNGTTWRIKYCGSFYERHIKHMYKWQSFQHKEGWILDNTIAIGTFIAYRYKLTEKHYHIAKIIDITDGIATMWHHYTRSNQIKTAIWKPLYILPRTNTLSVKKPKVLNADNQKLTSNIEVTALQTIQIATNIAMNKKQITQSSIDILEDTKLKHHVYRKTWKQENLTLFDQE